MTTEQNKEPVYTKEEIRKAIREELTDNGFMGRGNSRYYTITGIVIAALEKYDKIKELHQKYGNTTKD